MKQTISSAYIACQKKGIFNLCRIVLILFITGGLQSQTQIPYGFFGLNGWMPPAVGSSVSPGNTITAAPGFSFNYNVGGSLYTYSPSISSSSLGIKSMRFGGILHDINLDGSTSSISEYTTFASTCNALTITPVIQIPFMNNYWFNYCTGSANITATASASSYTNAIKLIVQTLNSYGVKYYSIGNEPDRYSLNGFSVTVTSALTASDISAYFNTVSGIIKTYNPGAIIVGPDLSYVHLANINDLGNQLIGGSGDITNNCDIFAFHRYGFNGNQGRLSIISQPATTFSNELVTLRNRIASSSNNPNLKIAITELNVDFQNVGANSQTDMCSNGFIAGQWLAEMYAVALTSSTGAPVAFMMPWSLHESGGGGGQDDNGLINGTNTVSPQYRSTYYHTKMMTEGFNSGQFYMGTTTNTFVKAFSAKDCYHISTMYMNQDSVNSHTMVVSQTTAYPSYSDVGVKLNMPSSWSTKTIVIGPQETQMFIYDACGTSMKQYTYNVSTYTNSYGAPALAATNYTRYCRCIKQRSTFYPKYNLRCAVSTETGTIHYDNSTLTTSLTLSDSAYVTGTLTVPNGYKLTIDNAEISIGQDAKIVVENGGQLQISNSNLHGCSGTQWKGIEVTGGNTDASQLSITDSKVTDAVVIVKAVQVRSLTVTGNYFENGAQGMRLSGCKGFYVDDNDFVDYTCAINTNTCLSSNSTIQDNMFFGQDTAVYFDSDSHTTLDIGCNGFIDYSSYGIYSNSATMKSQGSTTQGAGNNFISNSAYTNHQLRHTANAITYNCDPSYSFTLAGASAGYSVTTSTAAADASCYTVSPRMAHFQTIAKNYTGESKLLNCFPNPVNSTVTFSYLLENKVRNASIVITDLFGRGVKEITLQPEIQMVNGDLSDLPNGIYFYTLITDGRSISSRKIIISK
jgi:hypothetical protein